MLLIRGSSLTGFSALVTAHGGDPAALLELVNIDPEDLGERDRFIPLRSAITAVEGAATVLNVADFGRQLAMRQSIDILGPVGVAARTAATVADAFVILDTYISAYSPGIATRIGTHPDASLGRFEFDFLLNPPPPQAQAIELALGVTLRVLQLFLGTAYRPVAVHLPHPALAAKNDYRRYFNCPPQFNEPIAGFSMRASDLQRPLTHDTLAHQLALNYLSTTVGRHTCGLADTLRSVIRQLLPTGNLTADVAARQFGLHPKTLRRRLAAEGTTFAELVDQSRRDIAGRLLLDSDMSLDLICRQLGYSEQSVLTRSCRRWFDTTPTAYRQARIGSAGHPC
ncbi:AraC family transcriptional regulator [Mycobacterium sp. 21AC1]|uniref:AraC family transcriptional regulator n=1 Tax=[Mycobacterium] appelbergii TaxID=2939269 RepID=UPI0029393DD3|nr:AraC family transcriptional regulator [Mycobacterium sp. 21AC1]MDV3129143.1 AraC family transcriptional regulator [Mycobacterium sp. 21AC1]